MQFHKIPHHYMPECSVVTRVFLRMDGGAAKEEYERELEMKNQKIWELEVSNPPHSRL